MKKFEVEITEVLVGVIEVEAETYEEAVEMLRQSHDEAGKIIKPLYTEEMVAVVRYDGGSKQTVKLI